MDLNSCGFSAPTSPSSAYIGVFLSKRDPSLFNSGEPISRSLLLPAKFRIHSTIDTRLHRSAYNACSSSCSISTTPSAPRFPWQRVLGRHIIQFGQGFADRMARAGNQQVEQMDALGPTNHAEVHTYDLGVKIITETGHIDSIPVEKVRREVTILLAAQNRTAWAKKS